MKIRSGVPKFYPRTDGQTDRQTDGHTDDIYIYFFSKHYIAARKSHDLHKIDVESSQALSRINELALRVGVTQHNTNNAETEEKNEENENKEDEDDDQIISAQFSRSIRELFLNKFVQMLASYDKFVIVPPPPPNATDAKSNNTSKKNEAAKASFVADDSSSGSSYWLRSDYTGNFDSKMFLIEQPSSRLTFLSHLLETQMFAQFIDLKLISLIDCQRHAALVRAGVAASWRLDPARLVEPSTRIFDAKIRRFKESLESGGGGELTVDLRGIERHVRQRMRRGGDAGLVQAPKAKQLAVAATTTAVEQNYHASDEAVEAAVATALFESIDATLLRPSEASLQAINKYFWNMIYINHKDRIKI